jgi:hypothetical protein
MAKIMSESKFEINSIAVGKNYKKKPEGEPWLDDNDSLQSAIKDNLWVRWDGVEGSAEAHMEWIYKEAKSLMSEERLKEYRNYGEKNGVKYSINDELTSKGRGYGFFKLEGTLQLEPEDMVASMFNFAQIAESDPTVVFMKALKTYKNPKDFVTASYWCNAPGFPFQYRDGLDLSGYKRDDDGVMWQLAVSVTGKGEIKSMPGALKAIDRYWAYRLEPNGDGTTKTTLICQTELNGWIPKSLSNYFLCSVLIDYMATVEKSVCENKKSGEHQKVLKRLELDD